MKCLQCHLVTEHVETRSLYSAANPDVECGKIEMFVDLFPHVYGTVPAPIDISPRRPYGFQLRVALWSVRNVLLTKKSMGRPVSWFSINREINLLTSDCCSKK